MLTEASGVPGGLAVDGANRHDVMLLAATLASILVARPRPTTRRPQGVCLGRSSARSSTLSSTMRTGRPKTVDSGSPR